MLFLFLLVSQLAERTTQLNVPDYVKRGKCARRGVSYLIS